MFKLFLSLFQFILSADTFRIDSTDNLTNHIDNIKGHSIDITSMIHGHNKQNYSYKLKMIDVYMKKSFEGGRHLNRVNKIDI